MTLVGVEDLGEFEEEVNQLTEGQYIHVNRDNNKPFTQEDMDELKRILNAVKKNIK